MQEEMESENDKQNLDELIASILTDGHIDCLERALNNVQSSSLLSSTSSSATKVVTKVVKFLMDGGANTCLTKFANRLWSRTKPRGRSSGAGGLSLSPNFQGFLKLMIPGMEKGAFLRAMSVNSSDPTAFEILAQPLLEKLGYIFIFAGDRGARLRIEEVESRDKPIEDCHPDFQSRSLGRCPIAEVQVNNGLDIALP